MINGVCQKSVGEQERIWDYCGVVFPEGYISADRIFLFNNEQIERVYMIGYQDEELWRVERGQDKLRQFYPQIE